MDNTDIADWVEILEKITANIIPEIAKPIAVFVAQMVRYNSQKIKTDNEKELFADKFLQIAQKAKTILVSNVLLPQDTEISSDNEKELWLEIISQIEEIQNNSTKKDCESFIALIKNYFDDGKYEIVPVLFCIFTKLETTPKVFNAIRKAKPKKLYISSDGWREEKIDEKEKVEYLRKFVVENVDWECELKTRFGESNLGCKRGMEAAIDWFFDNEEMGIILEDDTLPTQSFFRFCSELLEKYKKEEMVWLISGTNGNTKFSTANSYYFSDSPNIWGWASWKRAWQKHDKTISQLDTFIKEVNDFDDTNADGYEKQKHLRKKFLITQMKAVVYKNFASWAYPWSFTVINNNGLSILPNCNLITNIGLAVNDVVHTSFEFGQDGILPAGQFTFPIKHQKQISPKVFTIEDFTGFDDCFRMKEIGIINQILGAVNTVIKLPIEKNTKEIYLQNAIKEYLVKLARLSRGYQQFPQTQKYVYLLLTKFELKGEDNFCAKCKGHQCLSVCPTKSVNSYINQIGEPAIKINRETCENCWECMKVCPVGNLF